MYSTGIGGGQPPQPAPLQAQQVGPASKIDSATPITKQVVTKWHFSSAMHLCSHLHWEGSWHGAQTVAMVQSYVVHG